MPAACRELTTRISNTFKTFGRAKMGTPTPGQKYAIQPGDTLFSIATAAYGAANATQGVTAIEAANPGINPTALPDRKSTSPPSAGPARPRPARPRRANERSNSSDTGRSY